jgi:type IV secretory pathway TrbD component
MEETKLLDIIYFIPLSLHVILLVIRALISGRDEVIYNLLYITSLLTAITLFMLGDWFSIGIGLIWCGTAIMWRLTARRSGRVWL